MQLLVPLNSLTRQTVWWEVNRVDANDKEAFWTFIRPFLLPLWVFFFPPQLPLILHKALLSLSTQPSSLTLPPSYSFPSQFSQIPAPCFPLTLMPPSLSLPSSAPPPPVLHSTSLHSGFALTIMSFPPAPPPSLYSL